MHQTQLAAIGAILSETYGSSDAGAWEMETTRHSTREEVWDELATDNVGHTFAPPGTDGPYTAYLVHRVGDPDITLGYVVAHAPDGNSFTYYALPTA